MTAETVSAHEAAAIAGLRYARLLVLVQSGEIAGQQVSRTWHVDRASLDAGIAAQRLQRGTLGPRTPPAPRRSNVHLLETALASGWTLERLSEVLGVRADKISRWPEIGVPNVYVPRLREIAETRQNPPARPDRGVLR